MRTIFAAFALLVLAGCAVTSPSIPEHYAGPKSTIKDSVVPWSSSKADFFYLASINGQKIDNSATATRIANSGRGLSNMKEVLLDRPVPATSAIFHIIGRTEYAAPIQALTNPVYEVSGDISFSPEQDKVYVVKGDLGQDYSGVWIEEEDTHRIVGSKIEIRSGAAAGSKRPATEEIAPLPDKRTGFKAARAYPYEIVVDMPVDSRPQFAGDIVAGTDWTGCKADTIWGASAPLVIRDRLASELADSKLFTKVSLAASPDHPADYRLKIDIRAFCGDLRKKFVITRGAGIVDIVFTLEHNGSQVWQRRFAKVMTDDDPEYSGSQITTLRNGVIHVMGDSLRLTLRDFFPALQAALEEKR
jgi:uncharacterized lipoprotein YmbA